MGQFSFSHKNSPKNSGCFFLAYILQIQAMPFPRLLRMKFIPLTRSLATFAMLLANIARRAVATAYSLRSILAFLAYFLAVILLTTKTIPRTAQIAATIATTSVKMSAAFMKKANSGISLRVPSRHSILEKQPNATTPAMATKRIAIMPFTASIADAFELDTVFSTSI